MKRTLLSFLGWIVALAVTAQIMQPVHFKVSRRQSSSSEVSLVFKASIDRGWHVYSPGLPDGGPVSASINHETLSGAKPVGALRAYGKEVSTHDRLFDMTVRYFEDSVTFVQRYRITSPSYRLSGYLEYGACNAENCLPPEQVAFDESGTAVENDEQNAEPQAEQPKDASQRDSVIGAGNTDIAQNETSAGDSAALIQNVPIPDSDAVQRADGNDTDRQDAAIQASDASLRSLIRLLLLGFLGGLAALFTPCVWPMVPLTVGFFLRRAKDNRRRGIRDAVMYGVSILAIYLALGTGVTLIFGASALNALSTNVWVNLFFFLLLAVFGLSMIGLFNLSLPSSWSNAADDMASKSGGIVSIFFMATTLVLVSFSCTAPIVGFLLVETASRGSLAAPVCGMAGFALALALPFTLFALFPRWLKSAPRSGAWMTALKVSLGFIELAFALKFLSVADMASGRQWLSRDLFLFFWIVIFAALGCYLLRFSRKSTINDEASDVEIPGRKTKIVTAGCGVLSLLFAAYMVPGVLGAPRKWVSAFAPPLYTQHIRLLKADEVRADYTDYDQGMEAARRAHKPVLIDFTGYGCVNCRKMESAVWTDSEVARLLRNEFVLISLYADDKQSLSHPIEITENGHRRTLRTVGDKWSYLQRSRFGANAQPFYVAVDNQGKPLAGSYGYDENVEHYVSFLCRALERYKSIPTPNSH